MRLSNADIRSANIADVYGILRDAGPHARSELTAATGLALPTISAISRFLLEEGLVTEVPFPPTSRGGRPPSKIQVSPAARVVVTVRFAGTEVEAVAADLRGSIVARSMRPRVPASEPWMTTAAAFARQIADLVGSASVSGALGAVALCVPGAANRTTGTWTRPGHEGWSDVPIVGYLAERFGVPVTIANTTAAALIGQLVGEPSEPSSAMMIWMARGVGNATVVDGRLIEGATGSAGELGHSALPGLETECECGRRGCVTTVTSVSYIRSEYRRATGSEAPATLLEMEATAPPEVQTMLDGVADNLAYAASWAVNIVNPAVLYLGGSAFVDGETRLFSRFRSRLLASAHEPNVRDLLVKQARSDDVSLGAIAVASELLPPLLRPRNRALVHLMPGLGRY